MRPFYRKAPYLVLALAFIALSIYFFVPTTWRGVSPILVLDSQELHWPSDAGEYSVVYRVASTRTAALRLKSVRFIPERGIPSVKQVTLRLENQNAILKEQQSLVPDGTLYDLSDQPLTRDEQIGFVFVFDPVEASRLSIDSWDPFRTMPHSQIEVSLVFWGHP